MRIEHVAPSRCREDFLRRVKANDSAKHEAKLKNGESSLMNSDTTLALEISDKKFHDGLTGKPYTFDQHN